MNKVSLRMRGLLLAALTYSLMGILSLFAEEGKEPLLSLPQKVNSKLPEFPPAPPDSGLKFPCPTETGKAPESPFFIFRKALQMTPEDQEQFIQGAPEGFRELMRSKLEMYKEMPEQKREWNLQLLDLHWYLFCGLRIKPEQIDSYIESVPEDYRDIISWRLKRWFDLTTEERSSILEMMESSREQIQKNVLKKWQQENAPRMGRGHGKGHGPGNGHRGEEGRGFGRGMGYGGPGPRWMNPPVPEDFSNKTNLEDESDVFPEPPMPLRGREWNPQWMARHHKDPPPWSGYGNRDSNERKTWMEINNFFRMSQEERERVMECLPKDVRRRTWDVVNLLEKMTPVQRQTSMKILLEISKLSPAERMNYIQGAERWRSLTEEEKQFFRVMCLPPEPILHPKPGPSISKKTIESNRDNVSIKRTESDRKLFQSNPD